jgi:2Fe-2S ferredoxin
MTNVTVTYIDQNGGRRSVSALSGTSVMQVAVNNNVQGIIGECGGAMMCATCHVYVPDVWHAALPPVSEGEDATLSSTISERRPNSRLSCQISLTDALDGLVVHLPESQL